MLGAPLQAGLLEHNHKLPIFVSVIKSDMMGTIVKGKANHYNAFIQYHLRKFCAENGAALCFCSAKL